jgi:cytochrome c
MGRLQTGIGLLAIGWCASVVMLSAQAAPDGGPTSQQVKGKAAYMDKCSSCHQENLKGTNDSPPLAGDQFWNNWETYNANNLLEQIRTTMPDDNPGGLPRQTYVDILAYILKFNEVPMTGDLPLEADALKKVTIKKP